MTGEELYCTKYVGMYEDFLKRIHSSLTILRRMERFDKELTLLSFLEALHTNLSRIVGLSLINMLHGEASSLRDLNTITGERVA
ncbi:MAG: hypothetical protein ACFFBS_09320 [Promethearchaeota archaeon]